MLQFFILAASVFLTYLNSFNGVFLLDDQEHFVRNPNLANPSSIGQILFNGSRPLLDLTLSLNYRFGGIQTEGYHLVNILIHLAAACAAWHILRQLLSRSFEESHSRALSFVITLIWALHPLQTESVTYIVQRGEALCSLFYLLTLDTSMRYFRSEPRSKKWQMLAILFCFLGIATKPVIITAPFLVLAYDRAFISASFRQSWRRHKSLYVGLATSWLLLAVLIITSRGHYTTAGFGIKEFTWWHYLRTQPEIIFHYLKLSVWPWPLCLDYLWWINSDPTRYIPFLLVEAVLIAASVRIYLRDPDLGFWLAFFWIVLAASSSFIPIADLAVEHRMYLPLLGVLASIVILLARVVLKYTRFAALRRWMLLVGAAAITLSFSLLTIARNADYSSEYRMWVDVLKKRPDNPRAMNNVGVLLTHMGRPKEAIPFFKKSLRIISVYGDAYNNLGHAFEKLGYRRQAELYFKKAVAIDPRMAISFQNLGVIYSESGKLDKAKEMYLKALEVNPYIPNTNYELAKIYNNENNYDEAEKFLRQTIKINPSHKDAHGDLGLILLKKGRMQEAMQHFEKAKVDA